MWKIKLDKGQQLFFTSDTHYNHKNICRGVTDWRLEDRSVPVSQTRDFRDLDEMNVTIVNNINSVVGQDDILIHLGDWSFGGFDSIKEFRDRIVCKNIYLLYGNHDHHIENNREGIQGIFTKTSQYQMLTVEVENKMAAKSKYEFVLMHYPICSWHNMNKGRFHLFGHVHLPPHQKVMAGRAMDVGMDGNNMELYSLMDIIRIMDKQPIAKLSLPQDHHEPK